MSTDGESQMFGNLTGISEPWNREVNEIQVSSDRRTLPFYNCIMWAIRNVSNNNKSKTTIATTNSITATNTGRSQPASKICEQHLRNMHIAQLVWIPTNVRTDNKAATTSKPVLNPLKPSFIIWFHFECSAPQRSNLPFLISDIRALWRSGLSARVPECQKLKM